MFFLNLQGSVQGKTNAVCEKKTKIAHNLFVTKATNLKTIFLKSP